MHREGIELVTRFRLKQVKSIYALIPMIIYVPNRNKQIILAQNASGVFVGEQLRGRYRPTGLDINNLQSILGDR